MRDTSLATWRLRLIERAASIHVDTVAVSHFMAINALVGLARDDDRLVCCHPSTSSCTTLELVAGKWLIAAV